MISSELDWESIRLDFPVTGRAAYLNSAAAGPLSRQTAEAASEFYREMMLEGDSRWDEWLAKREIIRKRVAEFINAEPEEIAFTTNTSQGMNLIIDALEGRGEVITDALEFPSTTITWLHRGSRVNFVEAADGVIRTEDLLRAQNEKTAVICMSYVQYSNGFRVNLEELGDIKNDHTLVVNASQAAGAFEIDVKRMKIDALCSTGHKWMLSGYGSGFVYLSRNILDETRPRAIGWLSVEEPFADRNREFNLRADAAARAELGCPHFAGVFALGASVDYMMKVGAKSIEERVLGLNRYLTGRLSDEGWRVLSPLRDESSRSAETLVAADNPKAIVEHLARRNVLVTEKPQGIRVSTHFFNKEEDVERLIAALEETRTR